MPQPDKPLNSSWTILFLCWLVASLSTMASLFFSYVMGFAPCVLCWYQRICLFPLVIILAVGLFPFDKNVVKFALPLAIAGWLTAFYHNLLYRVSLQDTIAISAQTNPYAPIRREMVSDPTSGPFVVNHETSSALILLAVFTRGCLEQFGNGQEYFVGVTRILR